MSEYTPTDCGHPNHDGEGHDCAPFQPYTPTEADLIRSFRAPWHTKPPQAEGESFAEYLSRLSIQSMEVQIADEAAARRGIAKIKAETKAEALLEAREHFKQVRFLRPIDGNIVGQYLTDTINRIEKETKDA